MYFLPAFNLVKVVIPLSFVFAERALVRGAFRVIRVLGFVVTVTARGAVGTAVSGTLWSRAITTPVALAWVTVASDSAAWAAGALTRLVLTTMPAVRAPRAPVILVVCLSVVVLLAWFCLTSLLSPRHADQ